MRNIRSNLNINIWMVLLSSLDGVEFRDQNYLHGFVYTHTVAPHNAYALCVAPPSTIFYQDYQFSQPSNIQRLDCTGSIPTPCQSIGTCNVFISSMCYLKHHEEELLVAVADNVITAFKLGDGVKWSKNEIHLPDQNEICKPIRIAAGGEGHLFVFDANNRCILMFSVTDGQYLGCLIKEGEQALGRIGRIYFCESRSQLIISHKKHRPKKVYIAGLNVE